MTPANNSATFWEHIEELRKCLIKIIATVALASVIAFFFYPKLIEFLTSPFTIQSVETLSDSTAVSNKKLIILSPTEGITTAFKISFWAGLASSSPIWLYFLTSFITPALHYKEKRAVLTFLLLTILFFTLGILFCYSITLPLANRYLFQYNAGIGYNLWSLAHYLDYSLILMLSNGIAFEAAIVLFSLVHYRFFSPKAMRQKRRYVIVGIFVFAGIVTPPDILTQLMLALPLLLIYEASVLYAGWRLDKKSTSLCPQNSNFR